MLAFDYIIFNNWGPYYGKHELKLDGKSCFIYAERGIGKSKLRNGLSWLLFDDARVTESDAQLVDLINEDAVIDNDHVFFIEAKLINTITKDEYIIRKEVHIEEGIHDLETLREEIYSDKDPKTELYFIKNGEEFSKDRAEAEVNNLFPRTLMDFFFIHGDVLIKLLCEKKYFKK